MTREITSRLIDRHDIVAIGQEDTHVWGADLGYRFPNGKTVPTLPILEPTAAGPLLRQYCEKLGIDMLIGHWDVWVLGMLGKTGKPFSLYIPIDAPLTKKWLGYMQGAKKVIAYSLFGLSELEKHLPPSQVAYIPHGVDCSTFKPLIGEKEDFREVFPMNLNFPIPGDAFLMATTQANVGPRKQLPLLLKTFRRFAYRHDDAHLYLHSNVQADSPYGYDLSILIKDLGLTGRVHFPMITPIIMPATDAQLNMVYNAADVYVTDSLGEGFGLPVLEAMASGTPAIAPANSSHTELVGDRGYLADCVPSDVYSDFPLYVPTLQEFPVVDQRSLLEKMEQAYKDRDDLLKKKGKASREFALRYDWSRVMPKWYGLLGELEEEMSLFADVKKSLEVAETRQS